jgi:hypothetical protein
MDTIRRQFANETQHDMNLKQTLIQRCEETIARLRNDKQPFSTKALIEKKKQEIVSHKEAITLLEQKLTDILDGKYDDEYALLVANKHVKKVPQKQAPKLPLYPRNRPDNDKYLERRIMSDELYYFKQCARFPEYLQRNLQNMPNNEGYRWRGIWFMGKRPERGVGATLHEKDPGGRLLVHEFKNGVHTVFEKNGRVRKLVSKTLIRPLV